MARIRSLRQQTWEKSAGICCLCGQPMFPDARVDDPLRFTIEHLVPKSRGGLNSIENLDGAHQWCNNFKSDSLMEELPTGYRKVLKWKIKHLTLHRKV
jgi:5-methylcytosine-specific restriction endonuclease McrA